MEYRMNYLNVTYLVSVINAINDIVTSQYTYLQLSTRSEANVNIVS